MDGTNGGVAPAQTGAEAFDVEIGGVAYSVGAPTLGAMTEFVGWARSETIRRTNEAIRGAGQMSPTEIAGYRDAAVRRAAALTIGSPDLADFLNSADGIARMLWAVIADKKGTTLEAFTRAVLSARGEEADRIGDAFRRIAALARLIR